MMTRSILLLVSIGAGFNRLLREKMKNFILLSLLLFLMACGGGGGGGTNTSSSENPFVISASTSAKSGSYGIGSEFEITISFKEPVTEGSLNSIIIKLSSGGEIVFTNVSGSSATAVYIVKEGENIDGLKIISITITGDLVKQAGASTFTKVPINIDADKIINVDTSEPKITEFKTTLGTGFYDKGQTIPLMMLFNEAITLNGTMSVSLNTGVSITIDSFTGSEIDFDYIIEADADVEKLKITAISLTGVATDSAGNSLLLDLPTKNLDTSKSIQIDTSAPYILSFFSNSEDGNYGQGSEISLGINLNEKITLTGSLLFELNSGGSLEITSFTGTSALGKYTVGEGHNASKLSIISMQILGSMIDKAGKSLITELPASNLDATHSITVDTLNSAISSIRSLTENGAYTIGSNISLQVNFEEQINLTGSMQLSLSSGGLANIVSFSGTTATGSYVVAAGENTNSLVVTAININGSAKDSSNNDLIATIPVNNIDSQSEIIIDTNTPYVISISSTSSNGTYRRDETVALKLTLSEPLIIVGSLDLHLSSGGIVSITTINGTSATFVYTVGANENTSALSLSSIAFTGSVSDAAGNSLSKSIPTTNINTSSAIVIDSSSRFAKPSQNESARFLMQATFGPNLDTINDLTGKTYEQWMTDQMNATPTYLMPRLSTTVDDDLPWSVHVDPWWYAVINGNDQLRQRVAFALSEILVISDQSGLGNYKNGLTNYYDILIRNSFGNFRTLLEEVTLSPMMGLYLSMLANKKPDPAKNIRPDENFAREIMQLFTIGLYELNIDGTYKLDDNGSTIPTYTQKNIEAFAHIYTGWSYAGADNFQWPSVRNTISPMEVWLKNTAEEFHDLSEQTLLNGEILPANTKAKDGLKIALDNIFNHANVGPFISKQLIQRLITSNPSPAYVGRVAKVFNSNSVGVRGDLKEVMEAIYLDKEARILPESSSDFGKLKEPLLRVSALWRAFKGSSNSGTNDYRYPEGDLIQGPLKSPTVFNFFQPTYSHQGEIRDKGLVSPEFQIHDESSITTMSNRLYAFTKWRVRGHDDQNPDANAIKDIMYINLDKEKQLAADSEALISHLNLILLNGEMTDFTKAIVKEMVEFTVINGNESADNLNNKLRNRATDAIIMIMNSPDFNIQR